jgi:hypothetical protein
LSVDGFLLLSKQYFNGAKKAVLAPKLAADGKSDRSTSPEASTSLSDAELSFARGAWTWLVSRPNVLVGGNRRWNKLTLDEILALPETEASAANAVQGDAPAPEATTAGASSTPQQRVPKSKSALTTRPRIHVTEETVWQAIAGHGVDYKRIPRLEWHLLQGIAPTKENGILQSDLRNLVGQDKRSVPKRTDFLAAKGYIVKRSIMIRASKTSKLWLAGFAPSTTETKEGSLAKDIKMTKETLTRDLSPVPWHGRWTGADIDVETFAESMIAIVKAWGVMRYADVRLKMGVEELRWQMRVMARLTRNLVDMGILKYTAATFSNSKKVWKDCVKFIRDPSETEWAKILATGKKTSKYSDMSKDRQPKPFALSLADKSATRPKQKPTGNDNERDKAISTKPTSAGLVGWVPEKPLAQTLFDAVDAAGPAGATNPQISAGTVGYNFRRYIGTTLTNMASCQQPPHLRKFQMNRKMVRVDKTSAFIYTTNRAALSGSGQEGPRQPAAVVAEDDETPAVASLDSASNPSLYGFALIPKDKLAASDASLSDVSRRLKGRYRQRKPPKRPLGDDGPVPDEADRASKRRRLEADDDGQLSEIGSIQRDGESQLPSPNEKLPGKPPGAYIGMPGSLDPNPKKTGRPKKSAVVIFKLEKLKDPAFFETDWIARARMSRNPHETILNVQYNGIAGRLCLNTAHQTVAFSRKTQPPGKEPLIILLSDLSDEPVVRPVPGCDDNSIVFKTKETADSPSWNYIFLFSDDRASQERVAKILKRVKAIANGEPLEDEPAVETAETRIAAGATDTAMAVEDAENSTALEPSEDTAIGETSALAEAEPTEVATQGKGKPKPKGKGRGKKGAPGAGLKPWKCEKCGGAWKNDIGLKYHLTKAQVSCNPDYVAKPVTLASRRRSKRPPTPPAGLDASGNERAAGDEERKPATGRTARRRGTRRRVELKSTNTDGPVFRGLTLDDSFLRRNEEPVFRNWANQPATVRTPPVSTKPTQPPAVEHSSPHTKRIDSSSLGAGVENEEDQSNNMSQKKQTVSVMRDSIADARVHPDNMLHLNADLDDDMSIQVEDTVGDEAPFRRDSPVPDDVPFHADSAVNSEPVSGNTALWPDVPKPEEVITSDRVPVNDEALLHDDILMQDISTTQHGAPVCVGKAANGGDLQPMTPIRRSTTAMTPKKVSPVTQAYEASKGSTSSMQRQESVAQSKYALGGTQKIVGTADAAPKGVRDNNLPRRRPLPDKPTKRNQEQQEAKRKKEEREEHEEMGITPFKPADYIHLSTDSKVRTAQTLDIVEYLLQNNGGIFPGDKALFYAVLRIYLKTFSGQLPPSLKNVHIACKRLTSKGKTREIVHAFRHSNGKFVTCTMLLTTEMDPNSIVPTVLKKKMQDVYPGVFIPPAFSPSKEELRLLEEFDKEPPETEETPKPDSKFRLRRDNLDVEVLNAPYYQDSLEAGGQSNPNGPPTGVNGQAGAETPKKRRKSAQTHSVAHQPSGRSAKKQKTLGSKLLSRPVKDKPSDLGKSIDDGELDNRGQGSGSSRDSRSPEPEQMDWEASMADNTPIAHAIKTYGLLPPKKLGQKKRRMVRNLRKLPADVGRVRNPGLHTLPHFFFANKYHEKWSKHTHSFTLTFLAPNTNLDDYHSTSWQEDLGPLFTGSSSTWQKDPAASALLSDTSSIATDEEAMSDEDEEPQSLMEQTSSVKEYTLVPPITLRETSNGVWRDLLYKFFSKQHEAQSFQMEGWLPDIGWILHQHLPANITEMVSRNKRRRVSTSQFTDRAYAEFSEIIRRCRTWEVSEAGSFIMTRGTLAPDYIFIDVSPLATVCQMGPVTPIWSEDNQFTLETLPYEDVAAMADDDNLPDPKKPRLSLLGKKPRGRPPGKKTSPKKDGTAASRDPTEKKRLGRKPKRIRLPAIEVEREHTAYPQSAEEYMDIHHGDQRSAEWNSEHTQLAAFVCVTTLLGGVSKSVDWGLMMRLFPDMSLSHLRKFYGEINKDRKSTIIDLTQKFQKAFLEAYEKGEVPPLDYDNVLAYDWRALTLWTRGLAGDESTLPPSYADLAQREMTISDRIHQPRDWRESFWLPARSLYNRYQDASSQAFAAPIETVVHKEDENLLVAMTWVRALCITAPYPPDVVSDRWETFKGLPRAVISDLIDKSIKVLQEKLVITKDKNLIVMRLNDRVVKAIEKAAQEQKFTEAAAFKRRLDRAFRKGKEKYRIPYTAEDDGMTMALLNLQAHDRIILETDNKYVPLGYEPFNYETRKFDRKYHHFRIYAVPTESYVYSTIKEEDGEDVSDELATLMSAVTAATPPRVGPRGELPLWVNFFGAVDEVRWRKCLAAVLFILSTRGAMRADAIVEQLKCVMVFEVQLILDWADRLGLLEQMTPGAPKCVTEWWWLAVDAQAKRAAAEARRKDKGKGRADTTGAAGGRDGSTADGSRT